jgi:hypothetical protein
MRTSMTVDDQPRSIGGSNFRRRRLTCVVKEDDNEIEDEDRISIVKEATRERSVRVSFD